MNNSNHKDLVKYWKAMNQWGLENHMKITMYSAFDLPYKPEEVQVCKQKEIFSGRETLMVIFAGFRLVQEDQERHDELLLFCGEGRMF